MAERLVGSNYTTPDLVAKVTGRARYAEDFRADGMLFCKLLLEPDAARPRAPHRHSSGRWRCPACAASSPPTTCPTSAAPNARSPTNRSTRASRSWRWPRSARTSPPRPSSSSSSTSSRCRSRPIRSRACGPTGPTRALEGNVWGVAPPPQPGQPPARPPIDAPQVDGRPTSPPRPTARCRWARRWSSGPTAISTRGFAERRAGARRDLRRQLHRPPSDGDAQRDGLLAERQVLPALLDAERRAHGGRRGALGRHRSVEARAHLASTPAAASAARAPAPCRWRFRRALEEGRRAGDDARQPRRGELLRPRPHQHDRAREDRLRARTAASPRSTSSSSRTTVPTGRWAITARPALPASLVYQPPAMRWRAVNVLTNTPPRTQQRSPGPMQANGIIEGVVTKAGQAARHRPGRDAPHERAGRQGAATARPAPTASAAT